MHCSIDKATRLLLHWRVERARNDQADALASAGRCEQGDDFRLAGEVRRIVGAGERVGLAQRVLLERAGCLGLGRIEFGLEARREGVLQLLDDGAAAGSSSDVFWVVSVPRGRLKVPI